MQSSRKSNKLLSLLLVPNTFILNSNNNIGGPDQVLVVRYGSDPLKTYLPDSDLDLTVIKKEFLKDGSQTQSSLNMLKL
jgi:hypothetical protein